MRILQAHEVADVCGGMNVPPTGRVPGGGLGYLYDLWERRVAPLVPGTGRGGWVRPAWLP